MSSFQGTTHHQSMDVARHPEKSKPTQKKLRAKDRPLANDFVSDDEFDGLLDAWFGNIARVLVPGRGFYIWGGYANCANYPPFLKKHGLYFSQAPPRTEHTREQVRESAFAVSSFASTVSRFRDWYARCCSITRILNAGSTAQQLGKLGREFAEQFRERSDFSGVAEKRRLTACDL
ncbi:MAG: hypothetical protein R3C01_10855 [Planctomycetaceae bacterium]